MLELKERDLSSFFATPFAIYGRNTPYVSPMLSDLKRFLSARDNPLFATVDDFSYFTAIRNGQLKGRIVAHVHRASNERFGQNKAYFGYFDCVDDLEVATALLDRAEAWARERGFDEISGNFNLTAMQQAGILTDGFENAPYTDQIWGPPYLPRLLEQNGYARFFPMTTFEIDLSDADPENPALKGKMQSLREAGFSFSPITSGTLSKRLEESRNILNASFIDNPMFVPVTREEYDFQAKEMKWIMDSRISAMVEKDGKPAGSVIAIPDLNPMLKAMGSRFGLAGPWHFLKHRLNRKRAVVIFQGVLPEYHGMGLNPLMLAHILGAMKKAGYEKAGGTWIADENTASLRQAEKAGAKTLHRLHLYGKTL